MMKNTTYSRVFSRRIAILGAAKIAAVLAIIGRYFHLQINEGKKYQTLSDSNKFSIRFNVPERGRIRDRNNEVIADNFSRFQVSLIPENTKSVDETLAILRNITPVSDASMKIIKKRIKSSPKFKSVVILDNVDDTAYNKIMVNYHRFQGLSIDEVPKRFYPFAERMSHITGYVGEPSEADIEADSYNKRLVGNKRFTIGREGMEKAANVRLRGVPGIEQLEVNAYGRPLFSEVIKPGIPGEDLRLTIDAELQNYIYETMSESIAGSAVVTDIRSGALLALVNVPSYDCNLMVGGISTENWQKWLNDELAPLNNRACSSAYPPGSTFKPMVALAALRAGMADSTTHFCPGFSKVGNHVFRCWKRGGHGHMDMYGALRESCDVWFYSVARKLGIEAIAEEARLFGLGSADDLPFAGVNAGLVGDPVWKRRVHNDSWYLGDTLVASIGQGYMLSSPLQLAMMTARLASGNIGLRPHIIADGSVSSYRYYDLPDNLDRVRRGLWQVVNSSGGGTAFRSRIADDSFQMAGKTGTSQVRRLTDAERERIKADGIVPWNLRDHALFVAYVPFDNPRYAISVIVEHGGSGSGAAAPIAKKIAEWLSESEKKGTV